MQTVVGQTPRKGVEKKRIIISLDHIVSSASYWSVSNVSNVHNCIIGHVSIFRIFLSLVL